MVSGGAPVDRERCLALPTLLPVVTGRGAGWGGGTEEGGGARGVGFSGLRCGVQEDLRLNLGHRHRGC